MTSQPLYSLECRVNAHVGEGCTEGPKGVENTHTPAHMHTPRLLQHMHTSVHTVK